MKYFFPYDKIRDIQKEFMNHVSNALDNHKNLLVHAPTGCGKTAASLAPVLKYALENNVTVFFLTSRHTQHLIAIETLREIEKKHNLDFVCVDLIGKKNMCNHSSVQQLKSYEFHDFCKDKKEKDSCLHFKNLKFKGKLSPKTLQVLDDLKAKKVPHVEEINQTCSIAGLCPFEVACLLGREAKVIIADYNHILNPNIRDSILYRMEKSLKDSIIIFDESHNLPDRARRLLTSSLSTYTIDRAIKEAKKLGDEEIVEVLESFAKIFHDLSMIYIEENHTEGLIGKQDFRSRIEKLISYNELIGELENLADIVLEKKERSFLKSLALFLENWIGPDDGFSRILSEEKTSSGKKYFTLHYKCLDPSIVLKPLIDESHSIIAMSGTLTPIEMYRDVFGFEPDEVITVEFDNPFPKENRLNLIVPQTSTKFTLRSPEMYRMIAYRCSELINNIPGNCAIYFPSYYIRDKVYEHLNSLSSKTLFLEQSGMSKTERSGMLDNFKSYKNSGAVLLGISAGSFGEGIDLIGDYLKSVIIVGLPLTKPDLETQELIRFYEEHFGRGWDYGYIYPAMIKIMQNAGRCIRSSEDKGIIVFIDERYLWKNYFKCFPRDWNIQVTIKPQEKILGFFD